MMRVLRLSLRARLLAGLIAVTAVFLLVMGTVSAVVMSDHLDAQFDADLLAAAGEPCRELAASPAFALAIVTRGGLIEAVSNGAPDSGQLVTGLEAMPPLRLRLQLREHIRAHTTFAVPGQAGGSALRAAARVVTAGDCPAVLGSVAPQGLLRPVLVLAEPRSRVTSQISSLVVTELITGGALIILLTLGGRWLIGRGLAPLDRMATTASQITARGDLAARMTVPGDHAEAGRLAAAINTMLDRIEEAFRARLRSEQKVRQFAADASHELRTPITTIRGYAELYGQGALGPDRLRDAMRRIESEARRMGKLVAELLELARLDRASSLDLGQTDLAMLVRDAAADAMAVEPDRPVRTQAPEHLLAVADETRIRQVLANLLANVREHTPRQTPVTIRLAPYPHGVLIEVADEGPGMTAHDAARAFDRFHRGTRDRDGADGSQDADRGTGSGLGLAIVQAIAAAHNGHADLDSAPGQGTRVRVWLPDLGAGTAPGPSQRLVLQ
ncbi:MAG TPA: HAMP domain-containing sensor histidine kinase [Streptosporangiaceae bacterium]|nr:HAMP domain-containing sensor histidine kinase [Streptosporangiaceae bacterium]